VLWLHVLVVALTRRCLLYAWGLDACYHLFGAAPATSAIRTTNRKCKVPLFSLEVQARKAPRRSPSPGRALSSPAVVVVVTCQPACCAVGSSAPPSCVIPRRSSSIPSFPLCVSGYHDYFMLLESALGEIPVVARI